MNVYENINDLSNNYELYYYCYSRYIIECIFSANRNIIYYQNASYSFANDSENYNPKKNKN